MGTLTKRERDGLEDVFLSIHSNKNRYKKVEKLFSLFITSLSNTSNIKLLKRAKFGLKKIKTQQILSYFYKKKKSLSK